MIQQKIELPRVIHTVLLCALLCGGCAGPAETTLQQPRFAIAIHGGAGVMKLDGAAEAAYRASLASALTLGRDLLRGGGTALDTVEQVIRQLEDDALFNAGKGAVYTAEASHELDASIMDGASLNCGAITGVRTIKNPISLARLVMERSRHVFFSGDGAEAFADSIPGQVERVPNAYFDTQGRLEALRKKLADDVRGTVGCVVLDIHGDLAAGTSTGGMTAKRFGRIGDSPIIGAGCYAGNQSCAVSCTGWGEKFIRNTVARDVAAQMEYGGKSLAAAARHVIHSRLDPGDGGLIAVSHQGDIAMTFNSKGMFRGCADSTGRFEVAIWKDR